MLQLFNAAFSEKKDISDSYVAQQPGIECSLNKELSMAVKPDVMEGLKVLTNVMVEMEEVGKMTQKLHFALSKVRQVLGQTTPIEKKSAMGVEGFSIDKASFKNEAPTQELLHLLEAYKEVLPSDNYKAAVNSNSWGTSEENISFFTKNAPTHADNLRLDNDSFAKKFFKGNILALIMLAFEHARNFQHSLLSGLVDKLEAGTNLATEIAKFSNYYLAKYADAQKSGEPYKWDDTDANGKEGPEKRKMNELIEFMKKNHIQIDGKDLGKWLEPKKNDNGEETGGGVEKKGEMTLGELYLLSHTLETEVTTKGNFNTQLQTQVTASTQTYTNFQDGLMNVISTVFRLLEHIFQGFPRG